MRWLKALVAVMSILIIIGVVVMIIGIQQKLSKGGTNLEPNWDSIPPSSQIIDWITMDDKVVVVIQQPNKELLFFTLHNNQFKPGKILKTPFEHQSKAN